MAIFDRFSLRLRVLTLASIPLFALVVTVGTTATIRGRTDRTLDEAQRSGAAAKLATELGATSLAVALGAQTFMQERNLAASEAIKARLAELAPGLERLAGDPNIGHRVEALRADAAETTRSLTLALNLRAALIADADGVETRLLRAGSGLERYLRRALEKFDGPVLPQIAIHVLSMRRAEQEYALARNSLQVAEFENAAKELAKIIPLAEITRSDKDALKELVA
ncbi:MAG: hypothetical protein ABWZ80_11105, partial [Beijerinckiaceae bacterium]